MPYQLEYKRSADSAWTVFSASLTAGQFPVTITGLVAGTSYDVRCLARDLSGNASAYSATSQATTAGATQPPVWSGPADIRFTFGIAASVDVSQYDSKGATDVITVVAGTLPQGTAFDAAGKRITYDGAGPVHAEASATHQLMADDGLVSPANLVSINGPQVTEGDVGQNVTLRFVISRAADGKPPIAYSAATTAAGTATPNVDFVAFSQSGTISAGQSINLDVTVIGDVIPEGDETVDMQVNLAWA